MKHEIKILSDKEFVEYRRRQKRQSFFNELEQMSKPSKASSFSVKDIKPEPKSEREEKQSSIPHLENLNTSEDEWSEFMSGIEEGSVPGLSSPIESITDERIVGYRLDDDYVDGDDKYSRVFTKELAMLSEVLKDVKMHGTRVNKELQKMTPTGKGAGNRSAGVSKGYSDLVEAYNSINTTKLQVIKAMADLRTKQVDWRIKDKATNPETEQTAETMADIYYKNIINGGTRNFIQNSMNKYMPQTDFQYDVLSDEDAFGDPISQEEIEDTSKIDSLAIGVGFNITQPLRGNRNASANYVNGDEFGNIAREKNPVDICVFEYGDGNYQFAAIDQDGEIVEGVELPSDVDPSILATLTIRPGSDYVYDKFNRKYRVIRMGATDISNIDSMDYPY